MAPLTSGHQLSRHLLRLVPAGCLALTIGCVAEPDALDPPPAAGSQVLAGECERPHPGWIWCDDFESDRLASYFEYDDAGGRFARVAGAGAEGSAGMRATYATAPQTSSGSLKVAFGRTPQPYFRAVDAGTATYREVYWRVYVRYPTGWQGGGADKLTRATSFVDAGSWAQSMIAHVWSGGDSASWNYLFIDPASGTDASGAIQTTTYNDFTNLRWLGAARGSSAVFAPASQGSWHCIEAHARLNDSGAANGLFELWVDGHADASRELLNWVGGYGGYGINAVFLENYWNAGSPVSQSRYLDNLVISTQRIGCPG